MKITQKDRILRYLQDVGSITAAEAMRHFGCFRLAARIRDLKDDGWKIEKKMESAKNRYDETVSYARYILTK